MHPGIKLLSSESKTQLVNQRKQNSYRRAYIYLLTQSFWTGTKVIRRKHIIQRKGFSTCSSTCCQWDGEDGRAPWERSNFDRMPSYQSRNPNIKKRWSHGNLILIWYFFTDNDDFIWKLGPGSQFRMEIYCLTNAGIPIIKIRCSHDLLIFIIKIPILGKSIFILK